MSKPETVFRVGIMPINLWNYHLTKAKIDYKTTLWALQQLSEFISEDEFSTVRLLMEKEK